MSGYQYVNIIGNVGRDPEMRYTTAGQAVCDFSVAVSRKWTDHATNESHEETTWFRVTAWRALAETANQYVRKGMQVMVTGRIAASAYMGKDGQPHASLDLTANEIKFLGARGDQPATVEEWTKQPEDLPF